MLRKLLLLCLGMVCFAPPVNDSAAIHAAVKPTKGQKFCPVFTDRIVGSQSRHTRYRGIKIYFSSDLAARKWMRDPVSYVDPEILPQLQLLTLPERLIPQHYCPVFPKRKVSIKDPSVIYQGQRVFVFDLEALNIWNSAPEKFLDPEILPQFAEEEKEEEAPDEEEEDQP